MSLPVTEKNAAAAKQPVAQKRASIEAAKLTPAQKAMQAFSSFASLASNSAETKPVQPETSRPTVIARSPALMSLNLAGSLVQPSTPFPVKPVAAARNPRSLTAITAGGAKAHVVDPVASETEMSSSSFITEGSVASSAETIEFPLLVVKPRKISKSPSPASLSSVSTIAQELAKPAEPARSPSPTSPTKFKTEASIQLGQASRSRVPSDSSSSSTVSVREQVLNWPPVSTEKEKEMRALARVKRSTRVIKNTSPRIQRSIDMLLNGAERSSATVSSTSNQVNSGNVPQMSATDLTQNKPSTSAEHTSSAVNFTAIRMAKNSGASGDRDTTALSRRSVDLAVKSIESCLQAERVGVAGVGDVRHSASDRLVNTPMQRKSSQHHGAVSGSHVDSLVRKFSAPKSS